jgi:hypothetical protein
MRGGPSPALRRRRGENGQGQRRPAAAEGGFGRYPAQVAPGVRPVPGIWNSVRGHRSARVTWLMSCQALHSTNWSFSASA